MPFRIDPNIATKGRAGVLRWRRSSLISVNIPSSLMQVCSGGGVILDDVGIEMDGMADLLAQPVLVSLRFWGLHLRMGIVEVRRQQWETDQKHPAQYRNQNRRRFLVDVTASPDKPREVPNCIREPDERQR